jgi:hypothetical protein
MKGEKVMGTLGKRFFSVLIPAFLTGALIYVILADLTRISSVWGKSIYFGWILSGIIIWYLCIQFEVKY